MVCLYEDVLKYFDASFSTIPIPFGLGSALMDLFKLALNDFFNVDGHQLQYIDANKLGVV